MAIVTKNPNDKRYYYEELVIQKLGSPNSDQSLIAYFYKTPGHSLRYGWAGKKTPTCDALTKSTAMSKAFFGAPCTIGTNTYFVGMGE